MVTGAGSGIGRAIALALGDAGAASVAVVDIDEVGAAATVEALRNAGTRAHAHTVDVGDAVALAMCFADVNHNEGTIGIVCNNAGIVSGGTGWPSTSLGRLEAVIDVNLKGIVFGTRLAVEQMAETGGAIVNTASIAGLHPCADDPVYAATNAAVVMFTRSCAPLAQSHRVRVNAVCPGIVDTPIVAKTGPNGAPAPWLAAMLATTALLEPGEVAAVVLDLIRDDERAGEHVVIANAALPSRAAASAAAE